MSMVSSRRVPLLDLRAQNGPLAAEVNQAIQRVVQSQRFIMGEDVQAFEREMASYLGVPHTVGCASGSDALYLALLAAGVGAGDAVLTTPFSFFATAGAIVRAGARPVLADIAPLTFNLDPARAAEAAAHSPNIKAIIPVHLYGGAADMDPLLDLARGKGWTVIEDGAQSVGARYKDRSVLGLGDIGCLSFFPSKNLGGFGDAGLLTTADDDLRLKLSALRVHGSFEKYRHEWVGINSRIDTLQAAVLRVKLPRLDEWTRGRQRNAQLYRANLAGKAPVTLPEPAAYQTRHVYNQYVIRAPRRDELKDYLVQQGIGSEVYYPLPFHQQPCFAYLGYQAGDFPESERAANEVLALPIHSGLDREDIEYVSSHIVAFYR